MSLPMPRRTLVQAFLLPWLFLSLTQACGSSQNAPTQKEEQPAESEGAPLPMRDTSAVDMPYATSKTNVFAGSVRGLSLKPEHAFFLQGVAQMGSAQPTLVLVQTDASTMCQNLRDGTMQASSTVLATVLLNVDGAPFALDRPYTAAGHHEQDAEPIAMAFFRQYNAQCDAAPYDNGAQAIFGQATLRALVAETHASADYQFVMEDPQGEDDAANETIQGHIEAEYCDAPHFFEHLEHLMEAVEPGNCVSGGA